MAEHAKLHSPSGASRWLNCPGQPMLCKDIRGVSRIYTVTGSCAHIVGEKCLRGGTDAEAFLGQTIWVEDRDYPGGGAHIKVDENMVDGVQIYVDACRDIMCDLKGATFGIEQRLDMSYLVPGMFGTGDFTATQFMGEAVVLDYKNGRTFVSVEDNDQLLSYALGLIGKDNPNMIEKVSIGVCQPNAYHEDGAVRWEQYPVDEVIEWGNDVLKPGAAATLKPNAPLVSGKWCKWCPAAENNLCPLKHNDVKKGVEKMFPGVPAPTSISDLIFLDPKTLSGDQLDELFSFSESFKTVIEAAEQEALGRLREGRDNAPDSRKLVLGKGKRMWDDAGGTVDIEDLLIKALGEDDAYKKDILSVAQAEKAFKKVNAIIPPECIRRIDGNPTMVSSDDKRPAINLAEQMFS